jgi:hypothetical protein
MERSVNKLDEAQLHRAYGEVARAAADLEIGQVTFVEGVRRIAGLRALVSHLDHDPDFMLFVAIDSESDHLPGVEQREHCTPEWLDQCDREARELEAFWIVQVRTACATLVTRFSV